MTYYRARASRRLLRPAHSFCRLAALYWCIRLCFRSKEHEIALNYLTDWTIIGLHVSCRHCRPLLSLSGRVMSRFAAGWRAPELTVDIVGNGGLIFGKPLLPLLVLS